MSEQQDQKPGDQQQNDKPATKDQAQQRWGEVGKFVFDAESNLEAGKEEIRRSAAVAVTENTLEEADKKLKHLKSRTIRMSEYRVKVTNPLEEVVKRLRNREKEAKEHVKNLEDRIISVKKEVQKRQEAEKYIEGERKELWRIVEEVAADEGKRLRQKAYDWALRSYNDALEKEIHPEDLDEHLGNLFTRIDEVAEKEFKTQPDIREKAKPLQYVSKEEVDNAQHELGLKIMRAEPVAYFKEQIQTLFSNYEAAFHNKEAAKEQAQKEAENVKRQEEKDAEKKKAVAELDAKSESEGEPQTPHKELKKEYEVDMEQTFENAVTLLKAFIANQERCIQHVRVKKWLNFSASQAGRALAKEKSKDPNFQPEGVFFKEVHKN